MNYNISHHKFLPFSVVANTYFDLMQEYWRTSHQQKVRHLLDEIMIPHFRGKKLVDVSKNEQLNFQSVLHRVIPQHHKNNVPEIKSAVQIFNQIINGKIDFESFIAKHYGAVEFICSRSVPHHIIYICCRYQANKIANELCVSYQLPGKECQFVSHFSDFNQSRNVEAITDWLIMQWAALSYGVEMTAGEEQHLKSELELLFQRKLADISVCYS
jgi:hypothetical protein